MKILMVNNYAYLRGGAEKVMLDEIEVLARAGHQVAAFSAQHPSNAASPLRPFFPAVRDHTRLSLLEKVRHFPRMVSNPEVKRAFATALDAYRPDIVHFHNIYGRLTPVVAEVASQRGIPTVLTAHDYKLICPSYLRIDRGSPCSACGYGKYAPAFMRACHKGSRLYSMLYGFESLVNAWNHRYDSIFAFICPSEFMLRSLEAGGIPRERLRLVPNFLAELPVEGGGASGTGGYVLYAGRLSREKGIDTLLQAFEPLDVELRIAGDGPEGPRLKHWVKERKLGARIRFLGHCDRASLIEAIRGSWFTVVPSEWFENAPMAIVEAFALSKPVVGADIGGIPELVIPGRTGALFRSGDAAKLRATVCEMLAEPAQLEVMGRNARALAASRFTPSAHVESLTSIYREAVQ